MDLASRDIKTTSRDADVRTSLIPEIVILTTAAAILIIIWRGHSIPMQPYPTQAACEETLQILRHAGHDLFETVPGFKAWCEPDGAEVIS